MPEMLARLQAELEGRYRIDRELGRGGMATVYLAHDTRHDRPVAIKVLAEPGASSAGDERFTREIRIAAQLSHPHILSLHDSGEAGGYRYYVMPFVAGESLRDRLRRDGLVAIDVAPLDAHNKFHLAEPYAMAGATDQALDLLEREVDEGFYPYPFIAEHCPFMAPLRGIPRFAAIAAKAQRLTEAFS